MLATVPLQVFRYLPLFICLLLACSCAKKHPVPQQHLSPEVEIADLREFPQNLENYAREYGASRRLLPEYQQASMDSTFDSIWFGPWFMKRCTIPRREVSGVFGRARGYKNGSIAWTEPEWTTMKENANIGSFPSRASHAITLRATDLRELPTHEPRFAKPTPNPSLDPFDYFQYSALPPGMPLLVAHTTKDGLWHYVECPIAGGWADASDIAIVDDNFKSQWRTGHYAALIRDGVTLPGTGKNGTDSKANIGTILPLAPGSSGNMRNILLPVRGKQGLEIAETALPNDALARKPMPLTPGNVARVGNQMMGQKYGWGGMNGLRDCSAMIRDLFAPFGIWLPRNSAAQARRGSVIRLDNMSMSEKSAAILKDGVPFLSLIGLPGHITLYVGRWHDKPAIFHNVWGVRIIKDGNDDERHIIGKAVVTSIAPGMELPNLYRTRTFVDRIRSLNTPGK